MPERKTASVCEAKIFHSVLSAENAYDGAVWEIVLPVNASEAEIFAASEMARLLAASVGVTLRVVSENEALEGHSGFYIGATALGKKPDAEPLSRDAFRIRSLGDSIVLADGNDRETIYAVYEFTERFLGAVWPTRDNRFFRLAEARFGWIEEDAPFQKMVHNIPMYMEEPEVIYSMNPAEGFKHIDALLAEMPDPYFARSEQGEVLRAQAGGHLGQVNVMHPALRELVKKNLLAGIALNQKKFHPRDPDGRPGPGVYDLSLNDNAAVSQDPATCAFVAKHGSESAPLIDFINELADAVAEEHPDLQLRTLAYMQSQEPPVSGLRPRDNVVIRWCDWTMGGTPQPSPEPWHPLTHESNAWRAENIREWGRISKALAVWDYGERYAGATIPVVLAPNLQPDLNLFREVGVTGVMIQNTESAPWEHAQFSDYYAWLALQLMWDIDADEPSLRQNFMRARYGAGAEEMSAAYEELVAVRGDLPRRSQVGANILLMESITPDLYQSLDGHFQRAAEAVPENSSEAFGILQERLTLTRSLLHNWNNLERKLAAGEGMGFSRDAQIAFFAAGSGPLLDSLRYSPKKIAEFLKAAATDVERWENPPDIPDRFAHLAPDTIRQFYWPDFVRYRTVLLDDPQGAGGKTMRLGAVDAEAHAHPVRFGLYNRQTNVNGPSLTLQRENLPPENTYGVYKIGVWEIRPGVRLFGHQSWVVGADLTPAFFPSEDPVVNTWEVWVSAKLIGPAYYPGSDQENGFYMDRVVLIRS